MSNQPPGQEQSDLPVGTVLGQRYQILGVLGRGGFATVYKANQISLGQPVAIKVLRVTRTVASGFLERFSREAKASSQIQHPDVVRVLDYGVAEDSSPYMVMELLRGHALSTEIQRNGPMDIKRALRLFIRCLDALNAAHKLGIVHRDLKPDNIFVTEPNSRVEALKLLDFGIAHMMEQQVRLTSAGEFYGTPQYLTPEYIRSKSISPAFDVYQVGLLFVEVVTGRPAVDGTGMQCMMAHSRGDLNIPEQILKSPVGPVLTKALSLDPKARYQNAGELRDALEAIQSAVEAHFSARPAFVEAATDVDPSGQPVVSSSNYDRPIAAMGGRPMQSGASPQVFRGGAAAQMPERSLPSSPLPAQGAFGAQGGAPLSAETGRSIDQAGPSGQLRPIQSNALREKLSNTGEIAATVVSYSPRRDIPVSRVSATIVDFKPPGPDLDEPSRSGGPPLGATLAMRATPGPAPEAAMSSARQYQPELERSRPSAEPERPSSRRHVPLLVALGFFLMLIIGAVLVLVLITTGVIGGEGNEKAAVEAPAGDP